MGSYRLPWSFGVRQRIFKRTNKIYLNGIGIWLPFLGTQKGSNEKDWSNEIFPRGLVFIECGNTNMEFENRISKEVWLFWNKNILRSSTILKQFGLRIKTNITI